MTGCFAKQTPPERVLAGNVATRKAKSNYKVMRLAMAVIE